MPLEEYRRKRDFRRTSEPEGRGDAKTNRSVERLFVVQKHHASRLHYDFRLELNGVLKSWAVPKGPSDNPGDRRLAIMVEDHPIEYAGFEGQIPEGEYGAGSVIVWDTGTWEPEEKVDPNAALEAGILKFLLHGQKLTGSWVLVKTGSGENHWLLMKHGAASGENEASLVERLPRSVQSGRTLEEVSRNPWQVCPVKRDSPPAPADLKVELATPAETPPNGDEWLHEIKYDGYRILAWKHGSLVRLFSRSHNEWTGRFAAIVEALRGLSGDFVFDGEIVVLDPEGRSSFQLLQRSLQAENNHAGMVYYVFDLIFLNGLDMRRNELIKRKEQLAQVLGNLPEGSPIRFSDHQAGHGGTFFDYVCRSGLEGVISKRASSRYSGRRTLNWLKVKCLHRQEFVIGGFTRPEGGRFGFGALLLGYYEPNGELRYAGRAGSGFSEKQLKSMWERMRALTRETAPFVNPPSSRQVKGVTWIEPRLVAEVSFTEWTVDGVLRHPVFQGLREDKLAADVRREGAMAELKPMKRTMQVSGIEITHPERPVFPDAQISKGQIAEYYGKIAPLMLPYIENRPLSVVRCPDGSHRECFFQKHLAPGMPSQIGAITVEEANGESSEYLAVQTVGGLVALAQFGVIEIHPWLSRRDRLNQPDMMVFDLDPGEGVPWEEVLGAALLLRRILEAAGLESFAKRTGGKGLHLVVPIRRGPDFTEVRGAAKAIAERLRGQNPDKLLTSASKSKRTSKIYVDYLRNGRGATAVAPYSLRARSGAPVAAPVDWDVLISKREADSPSMSAVLDWLEGGGEDPWRGYFELRQSLTKSTLKELGVR